MSKNRNRNNSRRRDNIPVVADIVPAPGTDQIIGPVGIPPPPDHIFKFRKNRISPAQEIWGAGTISYWPERAEYIEGEGNFVYYKGVPFPSKTVAPVEAINAINPIKRGLINSLRLLCLKEMRFALFGMVLIGKKGRANLLTKVCEYFNSEADTTLIPFYLEDCYYAKPVKEIIVFVSSLLVSFGVSFHIARKTAEIIGALFEYDNAYRLRMQDLLTEASKENLLENLPDELERLMVIEEKHENLGERNDMTDKFRKGVKLLKYAWLIPSFKRSIQSAISAVDFDKCRLDESDIYHTLLYGDYNVGGKSQEERFAMYAAIHGVNQEMWPPRIMIRTKNGN